MVPQSHDRPAALPSGEVHLWFLTDALPYVGRICSEGFTLLSPDEKKRFIDMKNRRAAKWFLLGRILLRRVLAQYLDEDPAALAFHHNANGKPELQSPSAIDISFNLSHSASDIVLAVTRAPAIGVDLEALGRADAAYRISQRFFSKNEIQQLELLGTKAPDRALVLWALKESIVKANGDTVWDGLEKISLVIDGRRIHWPSRGEESSTSWQLAGGPFRENFFLAFAVKASSYQPSHSLVFHTYRLGNDQKEENGFAPEFTT